ncbi:MAG: alcohol dehydrogenase catalytic domain-containing protein [Caldilineaceae bacterium]
MKVLQVTAPQQFEILDLPIPEPGEGEVLMKVLAVTTCPQWDLHLRHNEPMFIGHQFNYPYTLGQPGHEAAGEIAAVGAGVTSVAVGDRVSAWRDPGHRTPGCYAQYVVHRAENVIKTPEHLPIESLAPLELAMCVGTVFRTLAEMNALRGRIFGLTGLGPAGLIAMQMAKAEGVAAVYAFDPILERRALALQLGADGSYDLTVDLANLFPSRPNQPRLETSVDCVGAKASVEFLMDHTSDTVALFGVQREEYSFAPRHYRLTLCGYKGHSRESAEYAVGLIEKGLLDLSPLITHRLPLERYNEGIELLEARKAIKICFLPWAANGF